MRDFFDPTPEQQNVVLINAATLQKALIYGVSKQREFLWGLYFVTWGVASAVQFSWLLVR